MTITAIDISQGFWGAIFPFIGVIIMTLFIFLKRAFARRVSEQMFVPEGDNTCLYFLVNKKSGVVSIWTHYTRNLLHLVKFNLVTGKIEFSIKLGRQITDEHNGYYEIRDINKHYSIYNSPTTGIVIFDNHTGEKVADINNLPKSNSQLKSFQKSKWEYDANNKTIIYYDDEGKEHPVRKSLLTESGETLIISESERKHFRVVRNSIERTYGDEMEVMFIEDKMSVRYYVGIAYFEKKLKPENLKETFYKPYTILCFSTGKNLLKDPYRVVVYHAKTNHSKAKDLLISLVSADSSIIWQHKLADIMINPHHNIHKIMFYEVIGDVLYFIAYPNDGCRLSYCAIHIESGKIVHSPKRVLLF